MDVYAENILDHYRHPRNKLQATSYQLPASVTHTEDNPSCGDTITLHLKIDDGRIAAIAWDGTGCAISQAAMSLLSDELVGTSLDAASAMTLQHIYDMLGVPIGTRRMKCALLGLHTMKNALRKHIGKQMQSWTETAGTS